MRARLVLVTLIAGFLLPACHKNNNPAPGFSVQFEAPDGSGYSGGQSTGFGYNATWPWDFTLASGVTVTGKVTDGLGVAINNADVSFRNVPTSPAIGEGTTDASGNYSLLIGAGAWTAVVKSGSNTLGTLTVPGQVVSAPGPVTINFQFPATFAISGTVFAEGGGAIPNAKVKFSGTATQADVSVTADANGFYNTSLVPDTYDAVVTPAGATATTHLKQKFPLQLLAQKVQDFTLLRGIQVTGTVLNDLGAPLLQDTKVDIIMPPGSSFYAPNDVQTNQTTGTFSIGPVPPGVNNFEFKPPEDSRYPIQRWARNILGPTTQTEDFSLAKGFLLSGTILQDDAATPEANVKVTPQPTNGSLAPDKSTTDSLGRFETSVFAGTYNVEIKPDPTNLQLIETRTVTILADTTLDVTLTRGAILTGTVYQPDGTTPEPNIKVEIPNVSGASDTTNGSGVYSFLAPVGTHTLDLFAKGGTYQDQALASVSGVVVTAPGPVTKNITLALAVTGTTVVTGTVFAPDGVTPIQGVVVTSRDDLTGDINGKTTTNASGAYTLVVVH